MRPLEKLLLLFILPSYSLPFCFQCSSLSSTGKQCDVGEKFSDLIPESYDKNLDSLVFKGTICSLVTSATGAVYHRGSLLLNKCSSAAYRDHMAKMIGRQRIHYGAVVTCCSQSGCNWNYTTATQNLSVDKFTGTNSGTSADVVTAGVAGSWPWLVLVMVLIVLALLILVVYFRSREQLEKQQEQERFVGSRFTTPRYLREDARAREEPTRVRRRLSESDFVNNQMRYQRMMDQAAKQEKYGGGRRVSYDTSQSPSVSAWVENSMSHNNVQMGQKRPIDTPLSFNQEESSSRKFTPEMMRLGTNISFIF